MPSLRKPAVACAALLLLGGAAAASFQLDTPQHVLDAARDLAYDSMALYEGNRSGHTPGKLSELDPMDDGPYWWWHGAVFLSAYVDYWARTGDATYAKVVAEGLLAQKGEGADYYPSEQRALMSNHHQCSWAVAAMLAAESEMASPAKPDWLRLAQNAFDMQAARFEFEEKPLGENYNCGGGLRSDIDSRAISFYRKDTLANTCFMNLGARLAKFTGNETYAKYSERAWNWMWNIEYIDHQTYAVYYGAAMNHNCTGMAKQRYSGSASWLTEGAAFMYNFTKGSPIWKERTEKLTSATLSHFFPSDVAVETTCEILREGGASCYGDLTAYKGQLVRSMATTARVAPFTAGDALPRLKKSAAAAVSQCTGGSTGRRCGFGWAARNYTEPQSPGLLEQAHVLSAVSALVEERPRSASAGGGGGGSGGASGSGSGSGSGTGSGSGSGSGDKGGEKGGEKNAGVYARASVGLVAMASVAGWAALLLL
ncbi:hypothetical protein RB600_006090 [Gaeumannomyces tritici]